MIYAELLLLSQVTRILLARCCFRAQTEAFAADMLEGDANPPEVPYHMSRGKLKGGAQAGKSMSLSSMKAIPSADSMSPRSLRPKLKHRFLESPNFIPIENSLISCLFL